MLELVFVNRIIKQNSHNMLQKLLGFEAHPRDKQALGSKKTQGNDHANPTLYDCLEYFRKTEKLEKDNSWYCSRCKDHVEATKKIEIYKVPPILIFCLQRFKSHNIYFKDKLEDKVVFPLQGLDMGGYTLCNDNGLGEGV